MSSVENCEGFGRKSRSQEYRATVVALHRRPEVVGYPVHEGMGVLDHSLPAEIGSRIAGRRDSDRGSFSRHDGGCGL